MKHSRYYTPCASIDVAGGMGRYVMSLARSLARKATIPEGAAVAAAAGGDR